MVTGIASMVMSNTATAAMMIASITPFIQKNGPQKGLSKALLIGVPTAAAIGGMGTIIGSPPNVIAVDAINHIIDGNNSEKSTYSQDNVKGDGRAWLN